MLIKFNEIVHIKVPLALIEKWQSGLNLLAELTGVRTARIMRLQPPFLTVLGSAGPPQNPYTVSEQIPLQTASYCEMVVSNRARLLISNAYKDPRWDQSPDFKRGAVSYLGYPLCWPNLEVFGSLALLDWKENSFNPITDELLKHFQDAIQNDLHLLYFQEHYQEEAGLIAQKELFENLVAVARATAAHPTLEATLQNIIEVSTVLTMAEYGSLFLVGSGGTVTHSLLARGWHESEEHQQLVNMVMDQGVAGWVARHHQPVLIHDTSADVRWLTLADPHYQARSALALPLVRSGILLGVLNLHHSEPGHFNEQHLQLMRAATDQMALALDNARLYTSAQQELTERRRAEAQLRESEARYRAVSDMTSDYTFSVVVAPDNHLEVEWVTDAFTRITGFDLVELLNRGGWLSLALPEDLPLAQRYATNVLAGQSDIAEFRIVTKRHEVRWLRTYGRPEMDESRERVLRIFEAGQDITDRKEAEQALYQANQQLIGWVSELEQHSREIGLLNEMGDLFRVCRTATEAYSVIMQIAQQLFPSEMGALFILSPSRNVMDLMASWGSSPLSNTMFTPDDCWALRRGRLHLVDDTTNGLLCRHVEPPNPVSYLCVPMMAQGEALGVLYLGQLEPGHLNESRRRLAVTVAEHIALALANLKLQETLRSQSIRDPLTNLFNRRYMEESLEREMRRSLRNQTSMGILMLDLDNFKRFNDIYGHDAGDAVLRELGHLLQTQIRGEDIACRYGGEEFMLILPDVNLEDAGRRAEQLREKVKQLKIQHRQKVLGQLTISQGIALFPNDGEDFESVLLAADAALYRAKQEGRDRVVTWNSIKPPNGYILPD